MSTSRNSTPIYEAIRSLVSSARQSAARGVNPLRRQSLISNIQWFQNASLSSVRASKKQYCKCNVLATGKWQP